MYCGIVDWTLSGCTSINGIKKSAIDTGSKPSVSAAVTCRASGTCVPVLDNPNRILVECLAKRKHLNMLLGTAKKCCGSLFIGQRSAGAIGIVFYRLSRVSGGGSSEV